MHLDPNRALLGVLLGVLLIYRECLRPGSVIPGIGGGVLLVVGLHSLSDQTVAPDVRLHLAMTAGLLVLQAWKTWAWIPGLLACITLTISALHQGFSPVYAAATVPVMAVTAFFMRTAVRARLNKTTI